MDTVASLLGSSATTGANMAAPVSTAANASAGFVEPALAAGGTTGTTGALGTSGIGNALGGMADALPSQDTLGSLVSLVNRFRQPPAQPPGMPQLQRRGGAVPSATALQFINALQRGGGSMNPQMAGLMRILNQVQAP